MKIILPCSKPQQPNRGRVLLPHHPHAHILIIWKRIQRNIESNGLLFDTCKHIREIRDTHFSSYKLPGIVIDSFAYHYIGDWHWLRDGEESSNQPRGTYEKLLYTSCSPYGLFLTAPGSGMTVNTTDSIETLRKVLNYMSKE